MDNGFFNDYPNFQCGDEILRRRLNARYVAIIENHKHLIEGKRVLDIASNDGRWSFASVCAGAKHVTGIEVRSIFVEKAHENMKAYGISKDRYTFIQGDIFNIIPELYKNDYDTVLLLGYLYHTLRFEELFNEFRRLNPEFLIIDTKVAPTLEPIIEVRIEDIGSPMNATDNRGLNRKSVIVGWPSVSATELMLDNFGFSNFEYFNWEDFLKDDPDAERIHQYKIYRIGERVTFSCKNNLS